MVIANEVKQSQEIAASLCSSQRLLFLAFHYSSTEKKFYPHKVKRSLLSFFLVIGLCELRALCGEKN